MASNDSTHLLLKSAAIGSTLWVASALASTSLVFIPALLRPLTHKPFGSSAPSNLIATPAPSRRVSSLQVPSLGADSADGRLTPQPDDKPNPFAAAAIPSSSSQHPHAYETAARQFVRLDALLRRSAVPLELLAVGTAGALVYRSSSGSSARKLWIGSAGLLAAVFPFTAALMAPLAHKLARLAGDEARVEPYEDAPPDREAERGNAVAFLQRWSALNAVRLAGLLAAAGLGFNAALLE